MQRTIIILTILALLGALLWLALRTDYTLADALPPREVRPTAQAAEAHANELAAEGGWHVVAVMGTGSMSAANNYIPAAPAGADPLRTVVAYAVADYRTPYTSVERGTLCLYKPAWTDAQVMHQAAAKGGDGWIMSGNANSDYENGRWVMGRDEFRGICRAVVVIDPNAQRLTLNSERLSSSE